MKRLYTSVGEPGQGAVPRDFASPEECLEVVLDPPIDPPGCSTWEITSNDYGALPQKWARAVPYGAVYYDFFGTASFTSDPEWTDIWSALSEAQQNMIFQSGCYCAGEGITDPTLEVGTLQFPPVNALPFFWIPPDLSLYQSVTGVRKQNPVNKTPDSCCPDNKVGKLNLELSAGQINASVDMPKEPEKRFWSTSTHPDALLQNGFPRFCCVVDECDPTKFVENFIHYPRWLEDIYNPYDPVTPQEPVGAMPVMMDLNFNMDTGQLAFPLGYQIFHDGILHAVEWVLPDHVSVEATEGEYDFQEPLQPGVDLDYNKDWFGDDLLVINKVGDYCANQCDEFAISECTKLCDPLKYDGYVIAVTHAAVAMSEQDAIDAAFLLAEEDAPNHCRDAIVELCYSRRQTVAEGNMYEAEVAIYCEDT